MQRILTSVVVLGLVGGAWTSSSIAAQDRDGNYNNDRYENRPRDRDYDNYDRYRSDESYRDNRRYDYDERGGDYDRRTPDYESRRSNPWMGEWNRENIKVSKLPEAVQKTIRQHARDASVVRVDQETHRGKVQYRVQLRDQGQRRFFNIAADGSLLTAVPSESDYAEDTYPDSPRYGNRNRNRDRDWDEDRFDDRPSNYNSRMNRDYERRGESRESYRSRNSYNNYDYDYDNDRGTRRYYETDRYQSRGRPDYRSDDRDPSWQGQDRRDENPPPNRPADREWNREREYERSFDRYNPDWNRYNNDRYRNQDREWQRSEERYNSRRYDRDENISSIRLSDLPVNVRQTINKHAGDRTVERVEMETQRGQVVYRVHLGGEGKSTFFRVSPDGEFIGAEPGADLNSTSGDTPVSGERGKKEPDASNRPANNKPAEPKSSQDKPADNAK